MTLFESCKVLKSQFWFYSTKCKNPNQALRQFASQHHFVQPVFQPLLIILAKASGCVHELYCKLIYFIQLDKFFLNEKIVLLST